MIEEKALAFSDVHGRADEFFLLCDKIDERGYSHVFNLGDLCPNHEMLVRSYQFISVLGNSELFSYLYPPERKKSLTLFSRNIALTHGDKYTYLDFPFLKNGDIFLSGHTHIPLLNRNRNGIFLLNPGSLSMPRSNKYGKTVLEISERGASLLSFPFFSTLEELSFEL